jgi:UDP-N-acetylmuramoylalanine--D-glutamate ligase
MKHLHDLPVLVLGLGASGLAMARWCARHGARVTVADTRSQPPQLQALQREVPGAVFVGGTFDAALVQGSEIRAVYCSPGLSPETMAPVLDAARAVGLVVGGELDLFARALQDLGTVETTEPDALQPQAADAAQDELGDEDERAHAVGDDLPPAQDVVSPDGEMDEGVAEEPTPVVAPVQQPLGYHPAVLAITGTNGKTTVTSLTGQLVERAGKTVAVAGNIGPSLLDTLSAHMDADSLPEVWVLELSSFQLDGVQGFEPTAATVLNLSQDHLDWHGGMAQYAAAKARIFGQKGLMLLNREDPLVMAMLPEPVKVKLQKPIVRAHQTFGGDMPRRPTDFGIELVNGMAWLVRAMEADETRKRRRGEEEEIHIQRLMPADALRIRGRHNAINALAALALASAAGCSLAPMLYGLREYQGEPHRVELVGLVHDVEYFDDSKGTNVGATVAALEGLGADRQLVLILGGEGKGQDFSPLAAPVARHCRAVVLIGRDAPLIRSALDAGGVPLLDATSMDDAVQQAASLAHAGDAVLMSPACASFDMFDNYEHRARVFCSAVAALAEQAGTSLEGSL